MCQGSFRRLLGRESRGPSVPRSPARSKSSVCHLAQELSHGSSQGSAAPPSTPSSHLPARLFLLYFRPSDGRKLFFELRRSPRRMRIRETFRNGERAFPPGPQSLISLRWQHLIFHVYSYCDTDPLGIYWLEQSERHNLANDLKLTAGDEGLCVGFHLLFCRVRRLQVEVLEGTLCSSVFPPKVQNSCQYMDFYS